MTNLTMSEQSVFYMDRLQENIIEQQSDTISCWPPQLF
jgi:hypothetical protein